MPVTKRINATRYGFIHLAWYAVTNVTRTVQEEIIPPSQKSVEFWLRSRQGGAWGDKSTIDVNLSFEKILKLADNEM